MNLHDYDFDRLLGVGFTEETLDTLDFAICMNPLGVTYGTKGKCQPPNKDVTKKVEAERKRKKAAQDRAIIGRHAQQDILDGRGVKPMAPGTMKIQFSESTFDFKVCEKPNGERYGIPNDSNCGSPSKEVKGGDRSYESTWEELYHKPGIKKQYDSNAKRYSQWFANQGHSQTEAQHRGKLSADLDLFEAFDLLTSTQKRRLAEAVMNRGNSAKKAGSMIRKELGL